MKIKLYSFPIMVILFFVMIAVLASVFAQAIFIPKKANSYQIKENSTIC